MIDLSTIKLIVWDLDDTFWSGTLSEGGIVLPPRNLQLVHDLVDCGIMNSICSKNDLEPVRQYLTQSGIWDFFVFPSVNWDNKGMRLKLLIERMALRPANVLFIDDNTFNLREALHCMPDIQVAEPSCIDSLVKQVAYLERKDKKHKRLLQYKILERKNRDADNYESNEEFLYASDIRVTILHDATNVIDRLHELIMRSNQLNFTKKRISMEELDDLLHNPEVDCGYVKVKDKYGDYGIVGFYALYKGRLEHFVFSCRTMGQMIEQYVYAQLGFPDLEVVGEVRTNLNKTELPAWINQNTISVQQVQKPVLAAKLLLKGPCDLSHAQTYLKTKLPVTTEFTYVQAQTGQVIDAYNHSVYIAGTYTYTEEERRQIAEDCIFVDPPMLEGTFFTGDYDVIFLSSLVETALGIYRKKDTDIYVVYGDAAYPLTDMHYWDMYIGKVQGALFTYDYLQQFSQLYEFVGTTTPEHYLAFLRNCMQWLPKKTTLCILLGSTFPMKGAEKQAEAHQRLNEAVKRLAAEEPRIRYIDIDTLATGRPDFTDALNHYTARIYYGIASQMAAIVQSVGTTGVATLSAKIVTFDSFLYAVRAKMKKVLGGGRDNFLYHIARRVWLLLARKKG